MQRKGIKEVRQRYKRKRRKEGGTEEPEESAEG